MKKKLGVVTGCAVMGVVVLFFLTRITLKMNFSDLEIYPDIDITQDKVDIIYSYDDCEKIPNEKYFELENKEDNYGKLFEVTWNIKLNRILKFKDYKVFVSADLSNLSKDEKIFFYEYTNNPEEGNIFEGEQSGTEAYAYCALTGFTYGKSNDELVDIARKIKLVIHMEDENGKMKTKKIDNPSRNIEVKEISDDIDVEQMKDYFGLN